MVTGPMSYFISEDDTVAGITEIQPGRALPSLIKEISVQKMKKALIGKETTLPFDLTGGSAFKIRAGKKSLFEHMKAGGIMTILFIIVSVVMLNIIF